MQFGRCSLVNAPYMLGHEFVGARICPENLWAMVRGSCEQPVLVCFRFATGNSDYLDTRQLSECKNSERLNDIVRNHFPDMLLVGADLLREEFDGIEENI